MVELDINEVARHPSFPASALRYYEEKGLVRSIGRRGLRRVFDSSVLERLALITQVPCCVRLRPCRSRRGAPDRARSTRTAP